jgi:hypothetical protein
MNTGLVLAAALAGLVLGATRAPETRARLFEGIGWAALGLLFSLCFT